MKKRNEKPNKLQEFSKRIIVALAIMWFIGASIGIAVVLIQIIRNDLTVNLSDLLMYIGAPMTGGIMTYMLKSAFENKEKIKKGKNPPIDESEVE